MKVSKQVHCCSFPRSDAVTLPDPTTTQYALDLSFPGYNHTFLLDSLLVCVCVCVCVCVRERERDQEPYMLTFRHIFCTVCYR